VIPRPTRTQAERRDIQRVARVARRIEHVVDELVENADGLAESSHGTLKYDAHQTTIAYFRTALETSLTLLKRSIWRMAQRRSNESLTRWIEQRATAGAVSIDDLRAELRRRSTLLDESETEDEQRERESLDRAVQDEERRTASAPPTTKDQRLQELYDRRGMGRR
jgi:hypothetical protein